ncbi:MAG: RecX family transcriptional regulator [Paludibacter sp.]|nr:RecX family transcriptional regulator [Bacteroidales bacterium]MCM1068655.1 RecX family transcriptional regulator [Prevotella sp.]MCM1353319.1 RecX family transcriptional regulator [Bacteroides sp.]MCM1442273.1 RecX family transcriptional regulator [Muribaculum sp.]MCM1481092.1 RecX family transcriptional regulator [Paludibacter sp.]
MKEKIYTESELLQRAAAYCSVAERCPQEVKNKLYVWGMQEEDKQQMIVAYLTENGYLSEERYCKAYAHDKLLYQGWGRTKIRLMLQAKDIQAGKITKAIEEMDEDDYMCVLSDVLRKKARSLRKETGDVLRLKLLRFACSRGFTYQEVERAMRETEIR